MEVRICSYCKDFYIIYSAWNEQYESDIPVLHYSWATTTRSVRMLCPRRYCLCLYFRKKQHT